MGFIAPPGAFGDNNWFVGLNFFMRAVKEKKGGGQSIPAFRVVGLAHGYSRERAGRLYTISLFIDHARHKLCVVITAPIVQDGLWKIPTALTSAAALSLDWIAVVCRLPSGVYQ